MRELDFAGLRRQLEDQARPPAFEDIRARRRRRTTRWAVAGAVGVVVLVVGASASIGAVRHRAAPPGVVPSRTPSVNPTTGPQSPPFTAAATAFAPSGTLFLVARSCPTDCAAAGARTVLMRSADGGGSWATVGELPGFFGGRLTLLAADDSTLWLADDVTIAGSRDGGQTWQRGTIGGSNAGSPGYAAAAGGAAWFAQNGAVAVAPPGGALETVANQPPGHDTLGGLAAFGRDRAAVLTGQDPTWYVTTDRGTHWSALADPCRGTQHPGAGSATMAGAPDGSLWAVCAGQPGAGRQDKQLVVSTDGGHTWRSHGSLESSGYGTRVVPLSGTVAWRTGDRADLYRTTDGTHWPRVAVTGDAAGGGTVFFGALSGDTAAYVQEDTLHVTHDGGQTWTSRALPG